MLSISRITELLLEMEGASLRAAREPGVCARARARAPARTQNRECSSWNDNVAALREWAHLCLLSHNAVQG